MSSQFLSISPLNQINSLELTPEKRLLDNISGSYFKHNAPAYR